MALILTITQAGRVALVNAQNTGTAPVVIAQAGLSAQAFTPDTGMTALPGEHRRLATMSGDVTADDTIHLIIRDEGTDVFTVRSVGLYLGDGTLFAVYSQPAVLLEKSAQAIMLLAVEVRFEDIAATSLTFGNANFLNPPATTERLGVVELATLAETIAGTDDRRTPAAKMVKDAVFAWLDSRFGVNNASIWHPANDGAGSGLDADLLDGRDGSYYADISGRLGFTPLNRAGDTALGRMILTAPVGVNSPIATTSQYLGQMEVRASGSGAAMIAFHRPQQYAAYLGVDTDNVLRFGGWSAGAVAHTLWHSGNDGAGSGLDADQLDGQDGSYYANVPARLGYTPLNRAGDTMTGSLSISHAGSPTLTLSSVGRASARLAMQGDGNVVLYRGDTGGEVPVWNVAAQSGPFNIAMPITRSGFRVWDAANDGAGSGLDADLLDGQDGSYYANVPARLGFTPANRAGDTFTGPIRRDAGYYLDFVDGSPLINFDGNDFLAFDRAGDILSATIGGQVRMRMRAAGNLEFLGTASMTFNGAPIWHSGNDGSGSGLDADLLDGQDGSYYANVPARLGFTPANRAGDSFTGNIAVDRPGEASISLNATGSVIAKLVAQGDGTIALYRNSGGADVPVFGASQSGVFNVSMSITRAGFSVWDAGNDGAGSGLDADLLDGQQGSYYANVPARLGFTPANRAGDSFTGNITVDRAGEAAISLNATGSVIAKLVAQGDGTIALYRNNGGADAPVFGVSQTGVFNIAMPLTRAGFAVWDAANDGSGSGLDADLLDGQHGSYYTDITGRLGYVPLNAAAYTAADILAKLATVDGAGSGLDADLLDGNQASAFAKMADFTNDFSSAGWRKLPDGTIEQWCISAVQQSVETAIFVTFPIQFPNAVLDVQLTTRVDQHSSENDMWYQLVGDPQLNGCTVARARSDSDNDRPSYCRIRAIGR